MTTKGKIAWVVPKTYQTQSRIFKESQSLYKNGYTVKIYSMNEKGRCLDSENEDGVLVERIKPEFMSMKRGSNINRRFLLPLYSVKLLVKLIAYKPDLVYCSNLPSVHIGLLCRILFGSKGIYDSHDLFVEQPARFQYRWYKRYSIMIYEGFCARLVHSVVQTTDGRCKLFENYYGITPIRIKNKPLIVDQKVVNLDAYLNHEKTIIGYVGSVLPNRGLEMYVEVAKYFTDAQCIILGYAKGKWATDFIEKNKAYITLIPPVSPKEITSALKNIDIGVSLIQKAGKSYYYSCPTKVFELIASGTPQVASNFPEIKKTIRDNIGFPVGEVVNPESIEEVIDAIERLTKSKKIYDRYKENCERIKHLCSWETEEKILIDMIKKVME